MEFPATRSPLLSQFITKHAGFCGRPGVRFLQAERRCASDSEWGKMAQAPETLCPDMKRLLARFPEAGGIEDIEWLLTAGRRRIPRRAFGAGILSLAGVLIGLFGYSDLYLRDLYYSHLKQIIHLRHVSVPPYFVILVKSSIPLAVGGTLLYLIGIFWFFALRRTESPYRLLTALLNAIEKVDPAKGSLLASDKRTVLASQLLECAKRAEYFGPWVGRKLNLQVIRQQAVRASQVFRNCVYPALLGSDVELDAVKTVLAKATLKVGVLDWVKIGKLSIDIGQYEIIPAGKRGWWSRQLAPITLAALTAIPAIPVLVSLLK
jgi:hypothetical protein